MYLKFNFLINLIKAAFRIDLNFNTNHKQYKKPQREGAREIVERVRETDSEDTQSGQYSIQKTVLFCFT